MSATTAALAARGQRIWIDTITRDMLENGFLKRLIDDFSVSGLTSNPTIFERAIASSGLYDVSIHALDRKGLSTADIFFQLALDDLRHAAALFQPIHQASAGLDGWVSLEVSPLLSASTDATLASARDLYGRAGLDNLYIKVPGTPEGLTAIEQLIFEGIPINVTLLFSRQQYERAAHAYLRGLERRRMAGLHLDVSSVASIFVSRWDVAVTPLARPELTNRLGIAEATRCLASFQTLLGTSRWEALAKHGARPQRLVWASTGTKDPTVSPTLYVEALVAADTINTMPESTLITYAEHGGDAPALLANDAKLADISHLLDRFEELGIDENVLAARLQDEGVQGFRKSWSALLARIGEKLGPREASLG